jgi:catechol 2,3-dioxygenase-like lactoylglutathione lyase family enzyme
MPVIKVKDIAYGRLRSPDLDVAEKFLTEFGMVRSARTPTALYMRGTDPDHHLHVTELGPAGFIGFAYEAASEADLATVAKLPGASAIEPIDEPGGGRRVRLHDPQGVQIEIVYGIEKLAPLPVELGVLNTGPEKFRRANELCRLRRGPSRVKRIGHGVLMTTDVRATVGWYRETLGFIPSDDVYAGDRDHVIGSFNRCDRGDEYVDHHVFFAIAGPKHGLNHLSFEVQDFDDLMVGHEYLVEHGYEHVWGIGRHVLGSQIFDYWNDPWGRIHEHWTDSDVLNAAVPPNLVSAEEGLTSQWGIGAPPHMIGAVCEPVGV